LSIEHMNQLLKSVLFVGAHPDDETMLCGGTLALLARQGVQVHILCATRGEGGEVGEPPVCGRGELGAVREAELRCAARQLGATSVQFLGYVDPLVGPDEELYPFEADLDTLAGQVGKTIRKTRAEVVLSHGADGEYGHPAHQLLHHATRQAVEAAQRVYFYSFAARVRGIEDHVWNESEPAHLALDIRPWMDAKEAAALCHITQHALFKRRREAETVREVLRPVESFHRHLPPFEGHLDDPFADLLRAASAWMPTEADE
jgi:LmbE family N-acetylglucosaminyl deacetylase